MLLERERPVWEYEERRKKRFRNVVKPVRQGIYLLLLVNLIWRVEFGGSFLGVMDWIWKDWVVGWLVMSGRRILAMAVMAVEVVVPVIRRCIEEV